MSSQWQLFLEVLHKAIRSKRSSESSTKIYNNRTEPEIISFVSSNNEVANLISWWLSSQRPLELQKSTKKAKSTKDMGNEYFKNNDYIESLNCYTESARFSSTSSNDFSVAIANRSAALFHMCRYKEALMDIEVALETNYPMKMRHKVHLRAAQCYCKLRDEKKAEDELMKVGKLIDSEESMSVSLKESLLKQIAEIEEEIKKIPLKSRSTVNESSQVITTTKLLEFNEKFPFASPALARSSSPTRGRFVIAEKPIKKGDILFVEKPYAFVPLDHETSHSICGNCCAKLSDLIYPCRECTKMLYCSKKCWEDSWEKYHKWECAGYDMEIWRQIGIAHLAIKVLLVSVTTDDILRFREVQNLVTNIDKQQDEDLIVHSITAVMLAEYLDSYTDFLKSVDLKKSLIEKLTDKDSLKNMEITKLNDKKLFLSSLLLRHMLQLIANGHAITQLNSMNIVKGSVIDEQQERIAVGIYPSVSMMNHSCDPTIMNTFWNDYLIVRATKDVSAGGEIFNCYGPHFRRMPFEERQKALKNQYFFQCKCPSCTDTDLQCFMDRFNAFKCPSCSGPLNPKSLICLNCKETGKIDKKSITKELHRADKLFEKCRKLSGLKKYSECMKKLETCLAIRRKYLFKYHQETAEALDLLGKVSAAMGKLLESISYLEESLETIETIFGSDSSELAYELNKITDVCIEYLQKEMNRRSVVYKNTVKKTQQFLDQAEKIMNLISGPWHNIYRELIEKKKGLEGLLETLHI